MFDGSIWKQEQGMTNEIGTSADKNLKTRIGTPTCDIDRLLLRGKDTLNELVGKVTFTEAVFLAVTGKLPTPQQSKILDACLVILMDHGITPSTLVARLVADSVPIDIQVPIAAGLLTIGNKFMGTIAGAGALLQKGMASGLAPEAWAKETVTEHLKAKRRFPGFGHPDYFPNDPRTTRLFEVAKDIGLSGRYVELSKLLEAEIEKQSGRRVPLNATGAIGALLCEIDFPVAAMRGVAVISRSAGLLAHALEELDTKTAWPLTLMAMKAIPYDDSHDDSQ
jgi:citrate synthase